MFENMNEQQAREEILKQVAAYCDKYHNTKKEFKEGDRIPYASRVYDSEEMVNLVDSSLEFWLTAGRYTDEFEREFSKYLGVLSCQFWFISEFDRIYGADFSAIGRTTGKKRR